MKPYQQLSKQVAKRQYGYQRGYKIKPCMLTVLIFAFMMLCQGSAGSCYKNFCEDAKLKH